MFPRSLLIVLAIVLGVKAADAGVLLSLELETIRVSESITSGGLGQVYLTCDTDSPPIGVSGGSPDDLTSRGLVHVQSTLSCMTSGLIVGLMGAPDLKFRFLIANAALPASPVLDGLLKPS